MALQILDYDESVELAAIEAPVDPGAFYLPEAGALVPHKTIEVEGGKVYLGSYVSVRASHNVNVYVPEDFDPDAKLPVVLMSPALATGTAKNSHNDKVAQDMMRGGLAVVLKGIPHYDRPTVQSLSLTEDANEMMGVLNEVELSGIIGNIEEVFVYGESQGGMKGLGCVALQEFYGRSISDGQLMAICYLSAINWLDVSRNARDIASMVRSGLKFFHRAPRRDLWDIRRTLKIKDLHHHAAVFLRLLNGETGTFLQGIAEEQTLNIDYFDKDGNSDALDSAVRLETMFPNMQVHIHYDMGHVDGIMSTEIKQKRRLLIANAAGRVVESEIET